MATTRARTVLRNQGIRAIARPGGPIYHDLFARGKRVEGAAKRRVNVDTGRGRGSITTRMMRRNDAPLARIGTNVGYLRLLHTGTGIYGPRRRRITPIRAKVLVFKSRKTGKIIFTKSVRGMRKNPFLTRAMHDVMGRKRGR